MGMMTMAHSLTAPNASVSTVSTIPTVIHDPFPVQPPPSSTTRRSMTMSFALLGGFMGLKLVTPNVAEAAARRPPPPPTTAEKKDPNISGVQAKVLASKKRKEAMKQYVAKLKDQAQTP
ncbi:hypothetical protein LINGRAHAP2_LOCUS7001 [Linum grandiflorum]